MKFVPVNNFPWVATTVDGTTTSTIVNLQTVNADIPAASGFTYTVPTGLTATITVTVDDPASAGARWTTATGSVVGADTPATWSSHAVRGVKVARGSGSGAVSFIFKL